MSQGNQGTLPNRPRPAMSHEMRDSRVLLVLFSTSPSPMDRINPMSSSDNHTYYQATFVTIVLSNRKVVYVSDFFHLSDIC